MIFIHLSNNLKKKIKFNKLIEFIDIGGPTLIRAAAKNYNDVTVISNVADYSLLAKELKINKGATSIKFRKFMSAKVFNLTAYYDSVVANWLNNELHIKFPEKKTIHGKLIENLRYGENPHQQGSLYVTTDNLDLEKLHGKDLSYNNYNDIYSALSIIESLKKNEGVAIIKHASPCGVSEEKSQIKSFKNALACDPTSAFGGVAAINSVVSKKLAIELNKVFFEVIVSKSFKKDALKILKKKKNIRLIDATNFKNKESYAPTFYKETFVYQSPDDLIINKKNLKVISRKKPTKKQWESLIFAMNICKYVKSNAIVLVKDKSTIGIGSGQPNRVDSCKLAIIKARKFQPEKLLNCVAASDAFFPFTDGVEKLIQAGVNAIIQPSGSIRDKEIIKLANKTNTVLVFSKTRHFKH